MVTQNRTISEGTSSVGKRHDALTVGQLVRVIVFGVVFWFVAALAVRFGSVVGLFGPTASAILFAVTIPIGWVSVFLAKWIGGLKAGQSLAGIAIGTLAATCCDGIALTWGRGLYGDDPAMVTLGAAWLLWGVGFILLFAYLDDYR